MVVKEVRHTVLLWEVRFAELQTPGLKFADGSGKEYPAREVIAVHEVSATRLEKYSSELVSRDASDEAVIAILKDGTEVASGGPLGRWFSRSHKQNEVPREFVDAVHAYNYMCYSIDEGLYPYVDKSGHLMTPEHENLKRCTRHDMVYWQDDLEGCFYCFVEERARPGCDMVKEHHYRTKFREVIHSD